MTCCSSCSLHKRPSRRCACSYKLTVTLLFLPEETRLASVLTRAQVSVEQGEAKLHHCILLVVLTQPLWIMLARRTGMRSD